MAANDRLKLTGKRVKFWIADGVQGTTPPHSAYLPLGALTDKSKSYSLSSITSSADDMAFYAEQLVTNGELMFELSGEVRAIDKAQTVEFGVNRLEISMNERGKADDQPTYWVKMQEGEIVTEFFAVITDFTKQGATNEFYTFDVSFAVADSDTVHVYKGNPETSLPI